LLLIAGSTGHRSCVLVKMSFKLNLFFVSSYDSGTALVAQFGSWELCYSSSYWYRNLLYRTLCAHNVVWS